jgi:peptidyl-dipeptidase Dcp
MSKRTFSMATQRSTLFSRGGSREALDLFRDFTGGDPDIRPLLVARGLDGKAH